MKKYLISIFCLCTFLVGHSQSTVQIIDTQAVKNSLGRVGKESSFNSAKSEALNQGISIKLPTPDNKFLNFKPIESPLMEASLSKQYSDIKTYRIFDTAANSKVSGVLTVSSSGINALFFTEKGNVEITPTDISKNEYAITYQSDSLQTDPCGIGEEHQLAKWEASTRIAAVQNFTNGSLLRSYKMAICTTGEFFANNGSTQISAQAAVVSMVNSLRAVYEREVAITFTLVSTKIYENSTTDPFNPNSGSRALDAAAAFGTLATSDPANFALTVYNIGHVLHHSPGGGGVAYLSSVCRNTNITSSYASPIKAGAWSGGTTTSLATFIHEVGHQFSANHTFNSSASGCNGNRSSSSAYEPGSGSTYMSYWGSCSPDNISGPINRTYFHVNSLERIISFSTTNATCSINTNSGNLPPVVYTNPNNKLLVIPKATPFLLAGSSNDGNGDAVLYNWEQYDLGTATGGADDVQASTASPIFRSFAPTASGNIRSFPELKLILSGNTPTNDEALPTVARTIKMRLTARDSRTDGGGTTSEQISIAVDNSGPFLLTSQNTPAYWVKGSTKTISWSVNGTDSAPLNCGNVDILFSSDGGLTFPTALALNTPNDGSQTITVPNTITSTARIKLVPSNPSLIFFDINNVNISIVTSLPSCVAETSNILPATPVNALAGDQALNINGFAYKTINSISRSTSSSDELMPLIGYNASECVIPYSNTSYYKKFKFRVSVSGSYTFTVTSPTSSRNINIFTSSFQGNCTNWVAGNLYMTNTVTTVSPVVATLNAGVDYEMTLSSSWNSTSTGTVNINFSGDGNVLIPVPDTQTFYSYTYLIVNDATGQIKAIQNNADLSNALLFTPAAYSVYGLSYLTENVNLASYIDQPFSGLQSAISSGTVCAKISGNAIPVMVQNNCQNSLSLTGTATAGLQAANQTIQSTAVINSGTNVVYRAGNSITLSPFNSAGFEVKTGGVFVAEIGGCD